MEYYSIGQSCTIKYENIELSISLSRPPLDQLPKADAMEKFLLRGEISKNSRNWLAS